MTGKVNSELEARITIEFRGTGGHAQFVDVTIDTGFNGFVTLPPAMVANLGLTLIGREEGVLADGSTLTLDYYEGEVLLNGHSRNVEIDAVDAPPLMGMALLKGNALRMDVKVGGDVSITPLS